MLQRNILTDEMRQSINTAVETCRGKRQLTLEDATSVLEESDSLRRVLLTLFEYAEVNHIDATFGGCSVKTALSAFDEGGSDMSDMVSDGTSGIIYELCAAFKFPTPASRHNQSGDEFADKCRREIVRSLASIKNADKKDVVTLHRVSAVFDGQTEMYRVYVLLKPPEFDVDDTPQLRPRRRHATGTWKKAEVKRKPDSIASALPSIEEYVKFYTTREDTWGMFGRDIRRVLSVVCGKRNRDD